MSPRPYVRVKICATTTLADALMALTAGADALGFVFAPSKRQVNVAQVAAITAALPPDTPTVGVVGRATADEIVDIARASGLRAVQLHFAHDARLTAQIAQRAPALRIIQVLSIDDDLAEKAVALDALLRAIYADTAVNALLLDARKGGSGKRFDWKAVAGSVAAERLRSHAELIVAGGLNADNLAEAIRLFKPDMVDVASGVESSPGTKSQERLAEFVRAARTIITSR